MVTFLSHGLFEFFLNSWCPGPSKNLRFQYCCVCSNQNTYYMHSYEICTAFWVFFCFFFFSPRSSFFPMNTSWEVFPGGYFILLLLWALAGNLQVWRPCVLRVAGILGPYGVEDSRIQPRGSYPRAPWHSLHVAHCTWTCTSLGVLVSLCRHLSSQSSLTLLLCCDRLWHHCFQQHIHSLIRV